MKIQYDPQSDKWVRRGIEVEIFRTRLKVALDANTEFGKEWLKGAYEYVIKFKMYSRAQEIALDNIERVIKHEDDNYFNQGSTWGPFNDKNSIF